MEPEKIDLPVYKPAPNSLEDPLALEYGIVADDDLTQEERDRKLLEQKINAKIDERIARHPDKFPKAVWFILPNELGERLCFYGISPLLFIYLQVAGASETAAKTSVHVWKMITYFCPLIGSAISDSYLGKYKTIVYLSIVYLIGNIWITVTSIPKLRTVTTISIGLYIMALGTGGIKATVSSHGGDQFLKSQANALRRFFSVFYMAINIGSTVSSIVSPLLKDGISCFGEETCYFAGLAVPTVAFALAFGVFVYGERYYRIVPPVGVFVPRKILLATFDAIRNWHRAPKNVRATAYFWHLGAQRYGEQFAEESGEFFRMFGMILPISFAWMLYDQQSTEWQEQYLKMNQSFGSITISPEIWTQFVNSILVIILVYILGTFVYPFFEKRGFSCSPLRRMGLGTVLITVAFGISAFLQRYVDNAYILSGGRFDKNRGTYFPGTCDKCIAGAWQLPQWLILSLGECLFSPTGVEFSYTQVGKPMKAISSSFWLLTVCLGNFLVVAVENSLLKNYPILKVRPDWKLWIYTGMGALGNIVFITLAVFWYKYKPGTVRDITKAHVQ